MLTRPPLAGGPKPPLPPDLHVLGMPPAFNLSHDQTLQFKTAPPPATAGGGAHSLPGGAGEPPAPPGAPPRRARAHANCLAYLLKIPAGRPNRRPDQSPEIIQYPMALSTTSLFQYRAIALSLFL